MSKKYVQTNTFYLAGSGVIVGATSIVLTSFTDIYGNVLTMTDFGDTGYITLEPDTTNEEAATFTGVVANANNTYTLTGVKTNLAKSPYTETSGLVRAHSGGTKVVVTDNVAFWNTFGNTANTNTWADTQTFSVPAVQATDPTLSTQVANKSYVDGVAIAGAPKATDSVYGITKLSVAAVSPTAPIAVGDNDGRVPSQTENDALVGTSGTPSTTNKYVTNDDTATTATASKVARRGASGEVTVPTTPSASTDAASKSYVDSKSSILSIPLGESFTGATTPQSAFIANDLFQPIMAGSSWVGRTTLDNVALNKFALKITPRSTVTSSSIITMLGKVGAPADNILITVQADSAGSPSGSAITNGTSNNVAGGGLSTTSKTYTTFTFASAFTLTAGTSYWIVFQRSGATSDSDYYAIATNKSTADDYASFDGKYSDGAGTTWTASALAYVKIIPSSGSGSFSLWQSDANASGNFNKQFHGFVTTTGSAGAAGSITIAGLVSGFSSLLAYTDYYVSTTKGSTSITNAGIYVGQAQSATTIFVPDRKRSVWLNYGSWSGISTDTLLGSFEVPCDGIFMFANQSAVTAVGEASVRVSDDSAGSNPVTYWYTDSGTNGRRTLTVPMRKGQFIELLSRAAGALEMTFIPDIS